MNLRNVIRMLDEEIKMWYPHPTCFRKTARFNYASYRRWAIEECRRYLLDHPDQPPIIAIEEFRGFMDDFACEALTEEQNFMFSVAYDVATDVYDMLIRSD